MFVHLVQPPPPSGLSDIKTGLSGLSGLSGLESGLSGLESGLSGLESGLSGRMNETYESSPVFYRTSCPSGLLPCFLSLEFTIM